MDTEFKIHHCSLILLENKIWKNLGKTLVHMKLFENQIPSDKVGSMNLDGIK